MSTFYNSQFHRDVSLYFYNYFIIYSSNQTDSLGTSKRQWLKGQISSYLSKSKTTENLSTTTTPDQSTSLSTTSISKNDDNAIKTLQNAQSAPDVNSVVAAGSPLPTTLNGSSGENEQNHNNNKDRSSESKPKVNNYTGGPSLQTVCSDESHLSLMPQMSESPPKTTTPTVSNSSKSTEDLVDKGSSSSETTTSSLKNTNNRDLKSTSKATTIKDNEKKPKLSFLHHHNNNKHNTPATATSTTSTKSTKSSKGRVSLSELLHSQRSPTSPGVPPGVVGSNEKSKSTDNPLLGKTQSSIVASSMTTVQGALSDSANLVWIFL